MKEERLALTPAPEQPLHPDMFIGLQDQQILWPGVTLVAIEVVHYFARLQRAAQLLRRDDAVQILHPFRFPVVNLRACFKSA